MHKMQPIFGCTLLVGALLAGAQQPAATSPAAPAANSPAAPAANSPAAPAARAAPRFVVVIDAAHGGADNGARLSDRALEKDLVLTLSVRLRSMLGAH